MNAAIDQLRGLPIADRLEIIEQLWDDIHESEESLIIQDWHRDEGRRRDAELDAEPNVALTRAELWEKVERTDG